MIDESGGGTRPELPVVLGGRGATTGSSRQVPLRTIVASSPVASRRRRALTWWGSVAWGVTLLGCATSAFAIRDTMFPQLGRTQPPSAWEAPTRPPASIPYSDREGPLVTVASVDSEPVAAADGSPLVLDDEVTDSTSPQIDDDVMSAAVPTGTVANPSAAPVNTAATGTTVTSHTTPSAPAAPVAPPISSEVSAPTTTDNTTTTTVASDTIPDDGGGNQRGRSAGGSTGTSVP